ncbi:MAG TPA: type II toxin-antitoxin system PrlF family antitoxin [Longimicrobiaceae bacterium]|nr:type II toxin-antitoxin system PrlF family antitoxin [Longimicrobiaceae bacterium]
MPYTLRATTSGKQHALAMPKGFVEENPEFAQGRFSAHVVAPGHVLISADATVADDSDQDDPVVGAYLAFLDQEMQRRPDRISPLTHGDVAGLDSLLADVELSRDEDLGDFTLP